MAADPEREYLDAIVGDQKPSAEPSPEELYIRQQRAGGSEQEAQAPEESAAEPARDAAGRFTRAEEPEEEPQELSPHEAVDYLMGTAPTDEELAAREQAERQERLRSGEAVREYAAEARITEEMLDRLKAEHPGIDSPEAIAAMEPIFQRVAAEHGQVAAESPITLGQIFSEVNKDGHFSPDPVTEEWSPEALGINPRKSAFTR